MIGIRKTKELMLTGKLLSGNEAGDFDLINASAPADELDKWVDDFIAPIIDKSPFCMRLTKMTIDRGLDADIQSLMALESDDLQRRAPVRGRQGGRARVPREARTGLEARAAVARGDSAGDDRWDDHPPVIGTALRGA